MYFGIKSGALYVRDEKFGNTEEILKQLQHDIPGTLISFRVKRWVMYQRNRISKASACFTKIN